MAVQNPVYLLDVQPTEEEVTWKEMQEAIVEWLPSTNMVSYSMDEWQNVLFVGSDQNGKWSVSVPHEIGQDLAIALADIIRRRFPTVVVIIQNTVSEVMEPGDWEKMLAGEKPSIRKRGPLN